MARYTVQEFVEATGQEDRDQGLFELESARLLEVNLNGRVWTKMGSMVAYRGNIKFTREGMLEHGVGKLLKRTDSINVLQAAWPHAAVLWSFQTDS